MDEKKINFKALGRVIIVVKPEVEEKTESGIYKGTEVIKAESKLGKNEYLEVLEVGSLVEHVKRGDRILVSGTIVSVTIDEISCGYLYEGSVVGIKLDN